MPDHDTSVFRCVPRGVSLVEDERDPKCRGCLSEIPFHYVGYPDAWRLSRESAESELWHTRLEPLHVRLNVAFCELASLQRAAELVELELEHGSAS